MAAKCCAPSGRRSRVFPGVSSGSIAMSRIGQKPIAIPSGVTVAVEGQRVRVKGPKGDLVREVVPALRVQAEGGRMTVSRAEETKEAQTLHGLTRTLLANMVQGVEKGYSKELEIQGVGFKAAAQGQKLVITLGFCQPIEYAVPAGISVAVDGGTGIAIKGADKELVGDTAARIRAFMPAEPYKGKGIRYKGEYVRRKAGKTVA